MKKFSFQALAGLFAVSSVLFLFITIQSTENFTATTYLEQVKAEDIKSFLNSDAFKRTASGCCSTLLFPSSTARPGKLPMNLDVNGPEAQSLRDFVGRGNSLVFSGASTYSLAFVNRYFGLSLDTLGAERSGFARRSPTVVLGDPSTPLAEPSAADGLPRRLVPAALLRGEEWGGAAAAAEVVEGDVTAVRVDSMPAGSVVLYNDFPREPTASPAFVVPYCQALVGAAGARPSVSAADCPASRAAATAAGGGPPPAGAASGAAERCECGDIAIYGFDMDAQLAAADPDASLLDVSLAAAAAAGPPATVVDREPGGPPSYGLDPDGRSIIPPREDRAAGRYAYWARDGGWRDACGAGRVPVWDPRAGRLYAPSSAQAAGGSNFARSWCGCTRGGRQGVEPDPSADVLGCDEVPDARPFMARYSPDPDVYLYTGEGYDGQRVQRRADDRRVDPAYPGSVRGWDGRLLWMDENDAGPGRLVVDNFPTPPNP